MREPLSSQVIFVDAILPSEGVAAQTALPGAGLDLGLYGADRVLMVVTFGALTAGAVTSIKAQTDTTVDFDDSPADIAGTAQTVAQATGSDKTFMIDLYNPPGRYVRLSVSRGTANAVVASAFYLVYGMRNRPAVQTHAVEVHIDKIAGTA